MSSALNLCGALALTVWARVNASRLASAVNYWGMGRLNGLALAARRPGRLLLLQGGGGG